MTSTSSGKMPEMSDKDASESSTSAPWIVSTSGNAFSTCTVVHDEGTTRVALTVVLQNADGERGIVTSIGAVARQEGVFICGWNPYQRRLFKDSVGVHTSAEQKDDDARRVRSATNKNISFSRRKWRCTGWTRASRGRVIVNKQQSGITTDTGALERKKELIVDFFGIFKYERSATDPKRHLSHPRKWLLDEASPHQQAISF